MVGWMDDEALHRTLTTGRVHLLVPQPAGVLAQGRHLRPRPAGQVRRARLRRRRAARPGRPGRGRLPHRRRGPASTAGTRVHQGTAVPEPTPCPSPGNLTDHRTTHRSRAPAQRAGPALRHTWPTLATFTELARDRRVIPVVRRLLADAETPVGVYRKLAKDQPGTFLLESAEHGGVWSRYSIVGAALPGHADRARRPGALDRGAPGRRAHRPATRSRRCGRRSPPWRPTHLPRAAAADRRHGRRGDLRRRTPLGEGARRHAATSCTCPSWR